MPDDTPPTPSPSENRAGVESAPCALVLQAANRYGPWTVRSLRWAGYRVVVADERSGLAGRSRHCWRRHRLPSPKERPDDFLEALLALCRREDVDVVLAAEDERVNQLLAHHRDTLAPVLFAGPDAAQYDALCDKSRLPEVAAGVGVDHPEWVAVSSPEEDAAWPTLPSVVKPLASEIASWELKAVLVNTPAERERAVAAALAHTREAIVQERVVGRQWRVHFAHDGATFAWVPVATVRTYPAFVGVSTVSTVGGAYPTGLGEAARRLIDVVGYRGVGTVQFLQAGGRLLVHDVNLRLPAAVGASIAGGLDLPRLAFEIAIGLPIAPVEPRRATYLWLDGELRALVAGLRGGAVEASVRRRLSDLARCAVRRGDVVDPLSLRDPLLLLSVAERTVRRALRPAAPV